MEALEKKKRYLQILTQALCEESGLRLDFAEEGQWSINHTDRMIICPLEELLLHGVEYCAGCVAHEIGHDSLSRQYAFKSDCLDRVYLNRLFNGLEERRIEAWMVMKYPGVARWLSYQDRGLTPGPTWRSFPLLKRFIGCCCTLSETGDRQLLGDAVVDALEQTWPVRRAYQDLLPPLDIYTRPMSPEMDQRYRTLAYPRIRTDVPPAASDGEKQAFLYSLCGVELVEQLVAKSVQGLIDLDIERLAYGLELAHLVDKAEALLRTGTHERVKPLVHHLFNLTEGKKLASDSPKSTRLAEELYQVYWGEIKRKTERPISRKGDDSRPEFRPYREYRQKVCAQIETLKAKVQDALKLKKRLAEVQGHPWGHRPDLSRMMAFEADPRNYRKLWRRHRIPERASVAVLLLVDLSGSMRGDKIFAAQEGTVLLVETLTQLATPFAVFGFQDVIIPFVHFEEPLDEVTRNSIASMSLEVSSKRPGGNNQHGINDDGPCLLAAMNPLLERPEQDKVMIVISDGAPSGGRATEESLHAAVKVVTARGIFLFGLGLGPQTAHVTNFYPQALANIPVEKLALKLGELLKETLV